jgi:hypothetical protein
MCSATGYPVAEGPTYTHREIDYPAIVPRLAVTGSSSINLKPSRAPPLAHLEADWSPPIRYRPNAALVATECIRSTEKARVKSWDAFPSFTEARTKNKMIGRMPDTASAITVKDLSSHKVSCVLRVQKRPHVAAPAQVWN